MIFSHAKPESLAVLFYDHLDFKIRFMLNDFPTIYIDGQEKRPITKRCPDHVVNPITGEILAYNQ